jgi:hypothetical protein
MRLEHTAQILTLGESRLGGPGAQGRGSRRRLRSRDRPSCLSSLSSWRCGHGTGLRGGSQGYARQRSWTCMQGKRACNLQIRLSDLSCRFGALHECTSVGVLMDQRALTCKRPHYIVEIATTLIQIFALWVIPGPLAHSDKPQGRLIQLQHTTNFTEQNRTYHYISTSKLFLEENTISALAPHAPAV